MAEGFNIDKGGQKEHLNKFRHGIRKDQMSEKQKKLFDIFDVNKDGTLEKEETNIIENLLSGLASFDTDKNSLSLFENELGKSIFSGEKVLPNGEFLGKEKLKDADFMGFVKSVSDAAGEIELQEQVTMNYPADPLSGLDVGETKITTKYKDGTTEEMYYYADGSFKKKITVIPGKDIIVQYAWSNGEKLTSDEFTKKAKAAYEKNLKNHKEAQASYKEEIAAIKKYGVKKIIKDYEADVEGNPYLSRLYNVATLKVGGYGLLENYPSLEKYIQNGIDSAVKEGALEIIKEKSPSQIEENVSERLVKERAAKETALKLYALLEEGNGIVKSDRFNQILKEVNEDNVVLVIRAFDKISSEDSLLGYILSDKFSFDGDMRSVLTGENGIFTKLVNKAKGLGISTAEYEKNFNEELELRLKGITISPNTDRLEGIMLSLMSNVEMYEKAPEITQVQNFQSYREQIEFEQSKKVATVKYIRGLVAQARKQMEAHLEYLKENMVKNASEVLLEDFRFYALERNPAYKNIAPALNALAKSIGIKDGTVDAFTKSIYTKIDELKALGNALTDLENNPNSKDFESEYRKLLGTEYMPQSIDALISISQNTPWKNDPRYIAYREKVEFIENQYKFHMISLEEYENLIKQVPMYVPNTKTPEYKQYEKQLNQVMLGIAGKNFTEGVMDYISASGGIGSAVELVAFILCTMGAGAPEAAAGWIARAKAGAKVFAGYSAFRGSLNFTDDILKITNISDNLGYTDKNSYEDILGNRKDISWLGMFIGEGNAEALKRRGGLIKQYIDGTISEADKQTVENELKKALSIVMKWKTGHINLSEAYNLFKEVSGFKFDDFVTSTGGQLVLNTASSAIFGAVMGAGAQKLESIGKWGTKLGGKVGLSVPNAEKIVAELFENNPNGMSVVDFLTNSMISMSKNNAAGVCAKFAAETALFFVTNLGITEIEGIFSESNSELENAWNKAKSDKNPQVFVDYILKRLGSTALSLLEIKSLGMIIAMMMGMNKQALIREQIGKVEGLADATIKMENGQIVITGSKGTLTLNNGEIAFNVLGKEKPLDTKDISAQLSGKNNLDVIRIVLGYFEGYNSLSKEEIENIFEARERAQKAYEEEQRTGKRANAPTASEVEEARKALGLSPDEPLTEETVKNAYRKRALQCHPDKVGNDPEAKELFQQYTQAKEVLDRYFESQRPAQVSAENGGVNAPKNEGNNNPNNIVAVNSPEQVAKQAQQQLVNSKYKIATAGYSDPPEGYADTAKAFLQAMDSALGAETTAYITSPTTTQGSIDAITTEVEGFKDGTLFYTTAQNYIGNVNPDNVSQSINSQAYVQVPKYVLPDELSYSEATAAASNAFVAIGGRESTVRDFVNAVKIGNKCVIIDNTVLKIRAWNETNNTVGNASRYLIEQIKAVKEGKPLPYPEVGEFTREFIVNNLVKYDNLLRIFNIDSTPESAKIAGQKAAEFLAGVGTNVNAPEPPKSDIPDTPNNPAIQKKPYIAPEIKNVKAVLEQDLLTSDIYNKPETQTTDSKNIKDITYEEVVAAAKNAKYPGGESLFSALTIEDFNNLAYVDPAFAQTLLFAKNEEGLPIIEPLDYHDIYFAYRDNPAITKELVLGERTISSWNLHYFTYAMKENPALIREFLNAKNTNGKYKYPVDIIRVLIDEGVCGTEIPKVTFDIVMATINNICDYLDKNNINPDDVYNFIQIGENKFQLKVVNQPYKYEFNTKGEFVQKVKAEELLQINEKSSNGRVRYQGTFPDTFGISTDLKNAEREVRDKNGQVLYKEIYRQSKIQNKYEIIRIEPDGKEYKIGFAEKTPAEEIVEERNFSIDNDTQLNTVYINDAQGNRYTCTKVVDLKTKKVLFESSQKFKVIDENHFESTENGVKYDIQYSNDKVVVKTEKGETVEISIGDNGVLDENLLPLLKQLPGSMFVAISKFGLKRLCISYRLGDNGEYQPANNTMRIRADIVKSGNINTLLHELGHYIDISLGLHDNKEIRQIYEEERRNFEQNATLREKEIIKNFVKDSYKDDSAFWEIFAEIIAMVHCNKTAKGYELAEVYLHKYFTRTFAKIAGTLYGQKAAEFLAGVGTNVNAPEPPKSDIPDTPNNPAIQKKPYIAPEIENVKAVLEQGLLASDISDNEIPHQYRDLWKSCKTRAKYILESLKTGVTELPAKIHAQLKELVSDIKTISANSGTGVKVKLGKIVVGITPKLAEPDKPSEVSVETKIITAEPMSQKEVRKELKRVMPKDEYKQIDKIMAQFDLEHASIHLEHLKLLYEKDFHWISFAVKNGYFASLEGAEMFEELAKRFSAEKPDSNTISPLGGALWGLSVEQVQKLLKTGVLDNINLEFGEMCDISELSEEDISRLQQSSTYKAGLSYASDYEDINQLFITMNKTLSEYSRCMISSKGLQKIDDAIIKAAQNNPDQIKVICEKLKSLKHLDLFVKLFDYRYEGQLDIQCIAENLDRVYDLLHSPDTKLSEFNDDSFTYDIESFIKVLNHHNIHLVEKLLNLDGIDQIALYNSMAFASDAAKAHHLDVIIDKINSGEEAIHALPFVKYSEVNPKIAQKKYAQLTKFPASENVSRLTANTVQGQVVAVGDEIYINHNGSMVKLNISAQMYEKLFPEYQTACIQQGRDTGDCYFLSGVLYAFMQNPNARIYLLQCVEQDGNDIVVTIPGYKNYPVRFSNGEINLTAGSHAISSQGNLMIEQAYAKARYAAAKRIKDASSVPANFAMKYIYGGIESDTFDEIISDGKKSMSYTDKDTLKYAKQKPKNYKGVTKEDKIELLDELAGRSDVVISAGSGSRDAGYLPEYGVSPNHAYAIDDIDKAARTVTIVNPYNTLYRITLSYDQFCEYFNIIAVKELDVISPTSGDGISVANQLKVPTVGTPQMTTVTPQKLTVISNSPAIIDKYNVLSNANDNPIYDFDNAEFKDSANARVLERVTPPQDEEVIEVSNYEKINGRYPGTIAATTTLDKCIYTDRMAQCASLVVVDRAHNTQSLIHCFPGDQTDCAKAVIEHILSGSNPEDLEISIVNGSEYSTITTVQFLLDTVNNLAKGAKVELCNFPNWKELDISERALLLKDGNLTCCEAREVTNKNTNPPENITYYERGEYLPTEGVRDYIVKLTKAAKTPDAVADLIEELQTKEEAIYLSYHIYNIAADNHFAIGPKEGFIRLIENKIKTLPEYNSQPKTSTSQSDNSTEAINNPASAVDSEATPTLDVANFLNLSPEQRLSVLDELTGGETLPLDNGRINATVLGDGTIIIKHGSGTEAEYNFTIPADNPMGYKSKVYIRKDGSVELIDEIISGEDGTLTRHNISYNTASEVESDICGTYIGKYQVNNKEIDSRGHVWNYDNEYDAAGKRVRITKNINSPDALRAYPDAKSVTVTTLYDSQGYYIREVYNFENQPAIAVYRQRINKSYAENIIKINEQDGTASFNGEPLSIEEAKSKILFNEVEKELEKTIVKPELNPEIPDGYIWDNETKSLIKIDKSDIVVSIKPLNKYNLGHIEITDIDGHYLGGADYILRYNDNNGRKEIYFSEFVTKVNGLGIGSQVINELVTLSRDMDADLVAIAGYVPRSMRESNKSATNLRFYYKMGFRATDSEEDALIRYYIDNDLPIPSSINENVPIKYEGTPYPGGNKNLDYKTVPLDYEPVPKISSGINDNTSRTNPIHDTTADNVYPAPNTEIIEVTSEELLVSGASRDDIFKPIENEKLTPQEAKQVFLDFDFTEEQLDGIDFNNEYNLESAIYINILKDMNMLVGDIEKALNSPEERANLLNTMKNNPQDLGLDFKELKYFNKQNVNYIKKYVDIPNLQNKDDVSQIINGLKCNQIDKLFEKLPMLAHAAGGKLSLDDFKCFEWLYQNVLENITPPAAEQMYKLNSQLIGKLKISVDKYDYFTEEIPDELINALAAEINRMDKFGLLKDDTDIIPSKWIDFDKTDAEINIEAINETIENLRKINDFLEKYPMDFGVNEDGSKNTVAFNYLLQLANHNNPKEVQKFINTLSNEIKSKDDFHFDLQKLADNNIKPSEELAKLVNATKVPANELFEALGDVNYNEVLDLYNVFDKDIRKDLLLKYLKVKNHDYRGAKEYLKRLLELNIYDYSRTSNPYEEAFSPAIKKENVDFAELCSVLDYMKENNLLDKTYKQMFCNHVRSEHKGHILEDFKKEQYLVDNNFRSSVHTDNIKFNDNSFESYKEKIDFGKTHPLWQNPTNNPVYYNIQRMANTDLTLGEVKQLVSGLEKQYADVLESNYNKAITNAKEEIMNILSVANRASIQLVKDLINKAGFSKKDIPRIAEHYSPKYDGFIREMADNPNFPQEYIGSLCEIMQNALEQNPKLIENIKILYKDPDISASPGYTELFSVVSGMTKNNYHNMDTLMTLYNRSDFDNKELGFIGRIINNYPYSEPVMLLPKYIDFFVKLMNDPNAPKDGNFTALFNNFNDNNAELIKRLYNDPKFDNNYLCHIAQIYQSNKFQPEHFDFVMEMLKNSPGIERSACLKGIVSSFQTEGAVALTRKMYDKGISLNYINKYLGYRTDTRDFLEELIDSKIVLTGKKEVLTGNDVEHIDKIMQYVTGNNNETKARVKDVKSLISNQKLHQWLDTNIDNGLDMETIVNLARTQKKLFYEAQIAKKERTQIPKQVRDDNSAEEAKGAQVQEAKSEEVQQVIDALVELGMNANMAEKAYVKLCMDDKGFVDKIRLDAVLALVKTFGIERTLNDKGKVRLTPNVSPKDIEYVFDLAVGSPLSNANGQFRPDVIKDIIALREAGVTDVHLATDLAAIKNMNLVEMKDRFNTLKRNDINKRVSELAENIKSAAKEKGVDIDAVAEKAMTESKGGKVKKVDVESVKLRQLDDIYGAERILITKHKQEIEQYAKDKGLNSSQDLWGNAEAFKRWAEEKLADLLDFDKHPEYLAEGEYAQINGKRKEGIENWYKYLTTESDYKDNPFVHLLVLESMVKDFKPDSAAVPPAVSHEAFNAAHDALLQEGNGNVSFEKVYAEQTRAKAIAQFSHGTQVVDGIEGQWVTIPRSQKGEPNYDEHIAMVQALSEGSSWCLRFDNAHGYLQGGNLHFFVDKYGRSQVAINETDGKITQIQKRYKQDSTVPVPYVIVINKFMKANNLGGIDTQMQQALNAKPEFDRLKAKLTKLMDEENYLEVFKVLENESEKEPWTSLGKAYEVRQNQDGTYTISSYNSKLTDQYSLSDLGIDENKLLSNVSEVELYLKLDASNVTEMKKLRKVGYKIEFGDNNISDLRALEELAGHNVTWIKPEPPKPDMPDTPNNSIMQTTRDIDQIATEIMQLFGSYKFSSKQLKLIATMYKDYPEIVKSVLNNNHSGLTNKNIIKLIGNKVSEYINAQLQMEPGSLYTPKVETEMLVARGRYESGDKTLDVTLPQGVSEAVEIPEKIKAQLGTTSIHLADEYNKKLSDCVEQVTNIFGEGTAKNSSTKLQSVQEVSIRAKGPASIEPKLEKALRKKGHLDYDSAKASIGDAIGARIITKNLPKLSDQEISERIENMLIDDKPLTLKQKELLKDYIYENEFASPEEKLEAYYLFERFTRPLVEARTGEVVNELILSIVKYRMIKENLTIEQIAEQGIITDKTLLERLAKDDSIVPIGVTEINNYCGLWGIPEFTVEQAQALGIAMGNGKPVYTRADLEHFLYSNTEYTSPKEFLVDEDGKLPKAIKAAGYRTAQCNVIFLNGTLGEWQFRGIETNKISEEEHFGYDMRQSKNTLGPTFDEFKTALFNLSLDDYKEYYIYLEACYNYYHRIELGLPAKKPKLPEKLPEILSEENMKILYEQNQVRLENLLKNFEAHFISK